MKAVSNISAEVDAQIGLSMGISDRIASILSQRGVSQKQFARMMGKNEAEVSRWLGGTHNFTLSTIAKISSALGEDIVQVKS